MLLRFKPAPVLHPPVKPSPQMARTVAIMKETGVITGPPDDNAYRFGFMWYVVVIAIVGALAFLPRLLQWLL